ncbi:hypothetical protein GCM10011575_05580 [Microlunatus endophyticus]|uniref:ABC-type sugar transport system, permease component n=1 Tax=Microlunatus endophyticus TaxID=1716077 RepID=A0A917S0N1_9ACTN|nr:hypothetical protein [Microlunatus endophyticus]GGL50223.1 hypothetical protein GCM10011575_05580 [Microlunatus endophyticus]
MTSPTAADRTSVSPHREDRWSPWGWLALAPAVVLLAWQLVVPAVRTVRWSLSATLDYFTAPQATGFSTHNFAAPHVFVDSVLVGLAQGCLLLAGGLIIGPVIGILASRSTARVGTFIRILLALFLVSYAPVGVLLTLPTQQLRSHPVIITVVVGYLPIVIAVTALAQLSTRRLSVSLIIGGVTVLGCLAWGLQSFDLSALMVSRDPGSGEFLYRNLVNLQPGRAAALAVVLLVILWVFGAVAGLLLVASKIRFDVHESPAPGRLLPGIVAATVGCVVALALMIAQRNWVSALFDIGSLPPGMTRPEAARSVIDSWLPPLVALPAQLCVAGLAAFGIGWLRPAGRYSRWLLMIFAPWLLVGLTPLLPEHFLRLISAGRLNSFIALVPPVWVAVPAIFALTPLFSALRRRFRAGPLFGGLLLTALLLVIPAVQSIQLGLVASSNVRKAPAGVQLMIEWISGRYGTGDHAGVWLLLPPPLLAILAAAAVVAVLLVRTIRIERGPEL